MMLEGGFMGFAKCHLHGLEYLLEMSAMTTRVHLSTAPIVAGTMDQDLTLCCTCSRCPGPDILPINPRVSLAGLGP